MPAAASSRRRRRPALRKLAPSFASLAALGLAALAGSPIAAAAPTPTKPYFTALSAQPLFGRERATATALPDGKVLIAGGGHTLTLRTAEIFDPTTDTFSEAPGLTRHVRSSAAAAPLPNGEVLIAGGSNEVSYTVAETFDPTTGTFHEVSGESTVARLSPIAAALPDGDVLIAGGFSEGESQRSAELFDPTTATFTALSSEPTANRSGASAATLPDGRVLIVGGQGSGGQTAEVFDPTTDTFSVLDSAVGDGAESYAATALLPDGKLLMSGGFRGDLESAQADVFDPEAPSLDQLTAEATTDRSGAIGALLPDGKVLVSGGGWPEAEQSAELFVSAAEIGYSGADLGSGVVGQTSQGTVTVTNLGAQALRISAAWLAGGGSDFAIESDPCAGQALAFGATCTIGVRFTPAALGAATATLEFEDDEAEPTTIALTGAGVAPPATSSTPPTTTTPRKTPRKSSSVACKSKRLRSGKVQVTCRFGLGEGAWEARLRHAGRVVAHRRLRAGARQLIFTRGPRQAGAYRLTLVPVG